MTADRLRALADAAGDEYHPWATPVPMNPPLTFVRQQDLSLIAALGPDAARLLADAHFIIKVSRGQLNDQNDPTGEGREIEGEWLAGFAKLGGDA
jgi:hypothetical protein